ncbi:MAG: hypothetical protein RRC34_07855 [Lentisphaeria bacterium]|nr:hypothetical protein [Lentisphaeria bacterium]
MDRFSVIILCWFTLFAFSALSGVINATAVTDDLCLDEENIQISNALGHFARSVFLAYGGASPETSQAYLEKALREWPDSKGLLHHAAVPYLRRGDFTGLVGMLSAIAEENPEALSLHVLLGLMCRRADMPAEGAAVFEHVFYDLKHYEPFVVRELSAFYWGSGQQRKIPALLKKARRTTALRDHFVIDFVGALYHEGMASRASVNGRRRAGERHQQQALKQALRAAESYGSGESLKSCDTLTDLLHDHGEHIAAARVLKKAADYFPDDRIILLTRRAEHLARGGDGAGAREQLRALNVEEIADLPTLILIGQAALRAGDLLFTQTAYGQAMKQAPNNAPICSAYAAVLQFAGKPEEALAVLNTFPDLTADMRLRQARAFGALKRWREAETAWEKAGEPAGRGRRDKGESVSYLLLGATIQDGLGDGEKAAALAEKAVKTDPESPLAANYLGYTLADMGKRLDEAETLILRALSQEPENAAYLDSLAWVYFRQARWAEAGYVMARCLKLIGDDTDAVILDHAGDIFAANGARELARFYWLQALRQEPENAAAIRGKLTGTKTPATL